VGSLVTIDSPDDDDEKTEIEWNYLLYNFGTCAVWVVEVLFNVLDFKGYSDSHPDEGDDHGEENLLLPLPETERIKRTKWEVIALGIQIAFAVYYFIDSTSIAVHLSRGEIHRRAGGMLLDVCLNIVAYAFMVYRQFDDWRNSGRDGEQNSEHSSAAEVQTEGVV